MMREAWEAELQLVESRAATLGAQRVAEDPAVLVRPADRWLFVGRAALWLRG